MKKSPYAHLPIDERIKRAMSDPSFADFCKRERQNKYFDEVLPIVEKIATIDISSIVYDSSLISGVHIFTPNEIKNNVVEFYKMLDTLDPNGISLLDRLKANAQFFTTNSQDKDERSYCKSGFDKNGNKFKEIFVNLEGRIGDTETAIHEFCHSFGDVFMQYKRPKDNRFAEIPTVITDNLASVFMQQNYPQYSANFIENDKFRQVLNVKKARESLMDAMIVKVMCGEETFDSVMQKYGDLFKQFPDILKTRLEKLETFEFYPMEESKYLIPQAISLEMKDRFAQNPELIAKQLKHLIKNDCCMTEEECLEYLGLPKQEELIDGYVSKFAERMAKLDDEARAQQNVSAVGLN